MVFTGIIEEMGTVASIKKSQKLTMWDGSVGEGFVFVVECTVALEGAYIGCSIAVNGVCLTATEITGTSFSANCAPETLRKTNFRQIQVGDKVNVERSMKGTDRISGHIVQGHVDEAGTIRSFRKEGDSLWVQINASKELLRLIVQKGYIAVDGTSLTVCEVNRDQGWFNLMLISHTQQCVVLPTRRVGDLVNLEADAVGKYVGSLVGTQIIDRIDVLEQQVKQSRIFAAVTALVLAAVVVKSFRK
mmetsp:Transcript_6836/g.14642  ORF Transcript_6836/g.14642 Transcript_6836/m.14642 type:complete len:246 (-) Transcript_6836:156-893(-)